MKNLILRLSLWNNEVLFKCLLKGLYYKRAITSHICMGLFSQTISQSFQILFVMVTKIINSYGCARALVKAYFDNLSSSDFGILGSFGVFKQAVFLITNIYKYKIYNISLSFITACKKTDLVLRDALDPWK